MGKKIAVIAGPTASGKTRMSLALARRLNGEIVSADSMQIYEGMDIGTAKAGPEEQAGIAHHMLSVIRPGEDYSVARYVQEASRCCDDIIARGKLPIVVGGTGLYIDSLISGLDFAQTAPGDEGLRQQLLEEYDRLGREEMLRRLSEADPERAERLASGDKRRIVRALEIYMLTGITATEHDRRTQARPKAYDAAYIVLNFSDRSQLYRRIDRRVELMLSQGLYSEVERLLAMGLPPRCTAMQAIGYKEPAAALRGEITRQRAEELIKQSSRRYAKRQLTWFRNRHPDALWINWDEEPDFDRGLSMALDYIASGGK